MYLKEITMEDFTVFHRLTIKFSRGVNIFLGENGMGKTHVMKALYSACQAVKPDVSFSHKLVCVFRPDDYGIHRLVRRMNHGGRARVRVESDQQAIQASFTNRTPKWNADVFYEDAWEKQTGNTESTFIPAKEILSNAYNLSDAVRKGNVEFDDTYVDIIAAARIDISRGPGTAEQKKYLKSLQKITQGRVAMADERFYLKPGNQARIEFNLVAEGVRKIALLWQLVKNGTLEKGAVLFWDEPEANINPKYLPVLVELLLELQRNGVQIFISTHDYILAKYFELRTLLRDEVVYHSLYREEVSKDICVETEKKFSTLKHNAIMTAFSQLMDDVYHTETRT
ncbi:MAG: AAA family ATPase [Veillonellaceae bacterium]|uniref:AAA family ATPase n=1 Tax=uncultured Selenomonas sp. TaxID=159275 RepID=UPI0025EDB16B|nr:AAA family ATPase [uncultured Selenomonas sp.]MCI7541144.1 AAA family ATPase [Veillonellaceae bacterium]MDD6698244.1 AAA family ATPase [Veillonellaceae bacterium]